MSNFHRYNSDDIELVIDNTTGEAFTTINGYARMSGIEKNTLSNRLSRGFKGVHKTDLKKAEVLTPGGLQGVHLIPADTVFLWLMKDSPELAVKMVKGNFQSVCVYPPSALPLIQSVLETVGTQPVG